MDLLVINSIRILEEMYILIGLLECFKFMFIILGLLELEIYNINMEVKIIKLK